MDVVPDPGRELAEAKKAFLSAVRSRSDLPGINEINLAAAAVALLRAESVAPDSEDTLCMRQAFSQLGRPDVYDKVRSVVSQP